MKKIFKLLVSKLIKRRGYTFEIFYLPYTFVYSNYFCFLLLYLHIIFTYTTNTCKCVRIYKLSILT